jgi:hypothetical protein
MDHKDSFDTSKKRKRDSSLYNRVVPFHLVPHIVQFPLGSRLCGTHLKKIYSTIKEQQSTADDLNTLSGIHSYQIIAEKNHHLNDTNVLLMSLDQSPIKSQTTIRLEEQAPSAIRRLTAKLRQVVSVAGNHFCQ